jgi:NADH-quinone oxidoreductase subunit H
MGIEVAIACAKAVVMLLIALQVMAMGVFFERKVSAIIQDRIGANRASILGFAGHGLINTLVADPVKFLLKEDVRPAGADHLLHTLAPVMAVMPAIAAFAVMPFGDVLEIAGRTINLQAASLDVGILYILAMASLGVYGVVLAGWGSNNRWSLLGGIRGSAQMISYEIAMGLALVGIVLTYDTFDLQEMARRQGELIWGWLPAWGIVYQPLGFVIFFVAGIAESKRIPFDLPESESELVSGFFTEYSGAKHLMFMMSDFVEVVLVAGLITTLFFGGWQIPYLGREGFHFPWGTTIASPSSRSCRSP